MTKLSHHGTATFMGMRRTNVMRTANALHSSIAPCTAIALRTAIALFIAVVVISGCTTIRPGAAWRPWTRTVGNTGSIRPAEYTLRVEGVDSTTAGEGQALKRELGAILEDMLLRHGFQRVEDSATYAVTMRYRAGVHRYLDFKSVVNNETTSTTSWETVVRERKGHGLEGGEKKLDTVVVGSTGSTASSTVMNSSTEETSYDYTVTIELQDSTGAMLWQADAMWSSPARNIIDQIFQPLKLLVHELPSIPMPIRVQRVREDKAAAFYDLNCKGKYFSSPAVPYNIRFGEWEEYENTLSDPYAFEAYIDLLEYAGTAVPLLDYGMHYSDMKDDAPAEKLMLGGQYLIGDADAPVFILLTLADRNKGVYEVNEAYVATEEEYVDYLYRLDQWRATRRERYQVYE
jgi:hypothetical protein